MRHVGAALPAEADASALWAALRSQAGLRSKRWRVRAAAARLAAALARCASAAVPPVEVAQTLLLLALVDAQREVRSAAAFEAAGLLLHGLKPPADEATLLRLLLALLVCAERPDLLCAGPR
jgi:hypothetical protein